MNLDDSETTTMSSKGRLFSFSREVVSMNNFLERIIIDLVNKVAILGTKATDLEQSMKIMTIKYDSLSNELQELHSAYDELLSLVIGQ